ncbi:MAG: hypothetical protein RLZZ191_600 [Pseudomonadota bacterium]
MFARTERLLLRPSWPEDAGELHQAIADEGIVRNLARAPWPYTAEDAVRSATQEHNAHFPSFLMMLRTNGAPRLIGACGIGNLNGEPELGYWIGRPYWGLGFATEASRAVIEIAKTIGHKKLVASHFTDNPVRRHYATAMAAALRRHARCTNGRLRTPSPTMETCEAHAPSACGNIWSALKRHKRHSILLA